jgi:hypothetical protein
LAGFSFDPTIRWQTKNSLQRIRNMSDVQKLKPIPKEYPKGFSFWETLEFGDAIELAAEEAGLNVSSWLRQTIRARLRHEGWVTRQSRHPLANGAPRPNA